MFDLVKQKAKLFYDHTVGKRRAASLDNVKIGFIDVGAWGDLPYPWDKNKSLISCILRFEPKEKPEKQGNIITFNCALWDSYCERPVYFKKGDILNMLKPDVEMVRNNFHDLKKRPFSEYADRFFDKSKIERSETIVCKPLDGVLKELHSEKDYHFLKIDVQGAEWFVIKGAEKFLREQCLGIHIELYNILMFKDGKSLTEIEKYLNKIGFDLVLKYPVHGIFSSQNDCLFIKREVSSAELDTILSVYGLKRKENEVYVGNFSYK